MRLGLLVLLSLALCAAQTTQSEDYIPAPYFDEDENLSIKDCANETTLNQWAVSVRKIASGYGSPCPGIAISKKTVLMRGHRVLVKFAERVTGQSDCLKNLTENQLEIVKAQQIPTKNILCLKDHVQGSSNILVNLYKGRYFLRGTKFGPGNFYIDILPYIYEIASSTGDISALHSTPQSIPGRRFKTPDEKHSFPNCGIKRRTRRTKRDLDDTPVDHILSGTDAEENRHPWHAFIYIEKSNSTSSKCGGTLISPRAVLTAAHCIYGTKATDVVEVTIGIYSMMKESPGEQNKIPSRVIVHPDYNSNFHYDIGLMIFDEPFEITDKVHPICLWNEDSSLDRVAGKYAVVVGFGYAANYSVPDILQEAQLPIKSHKDCYLTSDRNFFGKNLWPGDNFCAGYLNGTTTCNGDSGGSLSLKRIGRWFIRGIVSFGKSTTVRIKDNDTRVCHPYYYSLFTDVATYMDWIVDNTPDISFIN
ncbi:CLIP domain-containing serine protease B4-like [Cloeon dipterum]|uniref:CLIP domain-containing serine protease B4-like n=1 Tax=Cloeon dipterum TaxID=197152 RepID=UPI00321FBB81